MSICKNGISTFAIAAHADGEVVPSRSVTGKFGAKALKVLSKSLVQMNLLPNEPDMSKVYREKFLSGLGR